MTDKHKRKIGEANKSIMLKKWQDPEYRKHMSEAHKGQVSPMKGRKHSEETKKKVSEAKKRQYTTGEVVAYWVGKKRDKATREKLRKARLDRPSPKKGKKNPHLSKENSSRWKGGMARCVDCNSLTSGRNKKRCIECRIEFLKTQRGEDSPSWKGGKRAMWKRQRAKRNGAEGSHTEAEWLALKIFYGFMCLCCKKTEPEVKLTEDHITPLSKNGSDYIDNIQPLCMQCNRLKWVNTTNYKALLTR